MADIRPEDLTQKQLTRLMLQNTKIQHIKIEVLNMKDEVINEIKGYGIDGSIAMDADNMIRRTLNMTFVANRKLEINERSLLWINKRLKLYIGIEKINTDIVWFNMGIFILSNPETMTSLDGRTITIKGVDKMRLFEEPFLEQHLITPETPIHEAIQGLATAFGETRTIIEEVENVIPYTLQIASTDTGDKLLRDITNLYMNSQTYYNNNGFLIFEKTKNRLYDPVIWEFSEKQNMTISRKMATNYDDIKNRVKVLGAMNSRTGLQPKYEMQIEGTDKMFSIENIGQRAICISEDNYTTEEQCRLRCEYEIERVQNMTNMFNIETAPILALNDVNKVINVVDNGNLYTCVLDKITIPLNITSMMSIECHQIFT